MNPRLCFHRLSVDLDLAGNPVGASIALYEDGQRVRETVLPRPGPFDDTSDVMTEMLLMLERGYGRQLDLFGSVHLAP